jgi:hypothetical protein
VVVVVWVVVVEKLMVAEGRKERRVDWTRGLVGLAEDWLRSRWSSLWEGVECREEDVTEARVVEKLEVLRAASAALNADTQKGHCVV